MSVGRKSATPLGLVGVGGFGQMHLRIIRRLELEGEVRLLAVADPTLHQFTDLMTVLESSGIRHYDDYREMLQHEPDLKAITIATPIPFHYEMVRTCIEHGLFVYLEKPPVPLYDQLQELIALDLDCRVVVGFQMVESAWSQKIKNLREAGRLGEITEVRTCACWPRSSNYYRRAAWAGRMIYNGEPVFDGPATNALSHLIHNIMFLGTNRSAQFDSPVQVRGEIYRARPVEGYDVACLQGTLNSGAAFFAALTHATKELLPFQMEIIGTKGWARVSQDGSVFESSLGSYDIRESLDDTLRNSVSAFIRYVKGETSRPSTLLKDAEGYMLATNGLLISSGKVHEINPAWIQKTDDDEIYSVNNLHATIAKSLRSPRPFSEADLPWAVETKAISTENFRGAQSAKTGRLLHAVAEEFDTYSKEVGNGLVYREL